MSNTYTIVGNLTRDPELKWVANGTPAVRFSVAVTRKGYNEKPDHTSFVNCSAIGTIAENVANSLNKGNRVVVTGRMEQRTWEKEDGTKGEIWELQVEACGAELRFNTVTIPTQHAAKSKTVSPEFEDVF